MDNQLTDRIRNIIKHLNEKRHPGAPHIVPKLKRIIDHIESGGIPGPDELEYVNYYQPRSILPKCSFINPLWECTLGLMEYCKHRPEWEKGENTCEKYVERTGR